MTDHQDERPRADAPDRCTIGQLSEHVGMTVRNIRAYQARGLLPPPVVDGRVGFYTAEHRERLTMIRRLRADGFNLVAISALLTGVVPVTTPTPSTPASPVPSPAPNGQRQLSDTGAELLALGVPVDAVVELHREVSTLVDLLAGAYQRVFQDYVRGPWAGPGSEASQRDRVDQAAATLPAIAASAVSSTLVPALRNRLASSTSDPADQSVWLPDHQAGG